MRRSVRLWAGAVKTNKRSYAKCRNDQTLSANAITSSCVCKKSAAREHEKIAVWCADRVTLLGAAAFLYRDEIAVLLAFNRLKPAQPFSSASTPASPDYSQRENWAALPDCEDSADALPAIGVLDQQASAAVDVFFVLR